MKISFRLKMRNLLFRFINVILRLLIPKQDNLVLLTAWLGEKYIDNTKYVYEYLQNYPQYRAIWMTRSKAIYDSLNCHGLPVCYFNSIRGFWLQLRAKVVFSSIQFADYNPWLINRCLYIDLGHGHPIKDPGKEHHTEESQLINSLILEKVNYYAIVASNFSKKHYFEVIRIPENHVLISDFARNDVFIDQSLRQGKNELIESFRRLGRKIITYMPTHRSMGKDEMNMSRILALDSIQKFCEDNNIQFIVKKHFYHRKEHENFDAFSNIIDISSEEDIDPQVLLYQSDILITDYSACYIDYLLLNRPIVFFQYDLEAFVRDERSLYMSFDDLKIGPVVKDKNDLKDALQDIINSPQDQYATNRNIFAKTYFENLKQIDGRKKVVEIMQMLLKENV